MPYDLSPFDPLLDLRKQGNAASFRQVIIAAIEDDHVNVARGRNADGVLVDIIERVRYLTSYSPSVGDTVWLVDLKGLDYLVIGKLHDGPVVMPPTLETVSYTHHQNIPSDSWTINHGLPFPPAVTIIDSSGKQVFPNEVKYPTAGVVIVEFLYPFGGKAFCS